MLSQQLTNNYLIKSSSLSTWLIIVASYVFMILHANVIKCSGSLLPVVNHNNSYSSSLVKSSLGYPTMQLDDHHICTKEENYTEIIQVPVQQPVRIRTQSWCLEIPPRCSNYRTEIREVIKIENITRTRTIRFCCEGYAGVLSANETICKPICRGGCGRGYCRSPDICKCDLGYIGKHCTQRCPHDKWGEDCSYDCHCRNGGVCDNKNGACRCSSGWIGETCEKTCAPGFYGHLCKRLCECSSERCNPQTGECISKESIDNSLKNNLPTIKVPSDRLNEPESQSKEMLSIDLSTLTSFKPISTTTESSFYGPKDTSDRDKFQRTYIEFNIPRISASDFTTEPHIDAEFVLIKHNSNTASPNVVTNIPTELEDDELTKLNPRVIQVIDWQQQHSNADNITLVFNTEDHIEPSDNFEKSYSGVITSLALFLIVLICSGIGFLIFQRRKPSRGDSCSAQHSNKNANSICSNSSAMSTNAENFKTFIQPLPDLPAFTQNLRKTNDDGMLCFYVVPEFYDSPTNNSAVVKSAYTSSTTTYGTPGPLYSTVGPKIHRKESLENHLYDEIRYPTVKSCRV